ncbi:hypothetical protein VOLCADRAFT_88486 [Volvox carteri f. nagariensis]|uniref:Uncharacterized protein n=1 Tax=Volvox carteri f. nagariensis TaxID=3068 RepID=D8TP46_VOLCA|nr:uncharacterized protein VOLCADRAFT_88486 [Volvox carteri f. nagariensis]EFJ50557.1 hypothetical protein VOLCADRAFT_88486 [Volvox carteri f. nagariensis]|eukprot:XP_002948150.1 hypothetical protein VOLCADRAFT_88486 [Volvox carteri f. nagariensis]
MSYKPRGRSLVVSAVSTTTAIVAGLMAAGGGVALAASVASGGGGGGGGDPRALTRSGMDKFRRNAVEASLEDFDRVVQLAPQMRPMLPACSVPPHPEESIWTFLCEAQLLGPDQARKQFLEVGRDPRPVMRTAYECFRTGELPDKIMAQVTDNGGHDTFYGRLYVGLWHEAHGNATEAEKAITAAVQTPYARLSGDYMASLARHVPFWTPAAPPPPGSRPRTTPISNVLYSDSGSPTRQTRRRGPLL